MSNLPGFTAPLEELVTDGGFEGAPANWQLWGTGSLTVLTNASEARSGRQAVRIEPAADGEPHVRVHPSAKLPAQPGAEYRLTVWVRGQGTVAPFAWAYAAGGAFIGGAKLNEGQGFEKPLTGEWQPLSMSFTFDDEDVGAMIPGVALRGTKTWLVVDDLSVTVDRARYPAPPAAAGAGWLLGNPTELFIPQGGLVQLRAALRSPTNAPTRDFRLVFTVPAALRLLDYDQPGGTARDLAPVAVTSRPVRVARLACRRYELRYPAERVAPFNAVVGKDWELQPPHTGTVAIAAIFFQMDDRLRRDSYPVTVERMVNGQPAGDPVRLTLRVMPAFSGKSPNRIQIYYYSQQVYPHAVQELNARGWSPPYPPAVAEAVWRQFQGLGNTRFEVGGWGLEDKPVFQEFVGDLKQRGAQIGFGRNSAMNYRLGDLADPITEKTDGALKIVAAHPEVQWKPYAGTDSSIPAVWKPSVFFRWFDTKLLFDPATRARRPTMWCQQYLADDGALYHDYWVERFRYLKQQIPVDFVHWDWEYANVGWSCFCDRDLTAFRVFAKLPADAPLTDVIVAEKYPQDWLKFRAWQNIEILGRFHKLLREVGLKFEAYSPGPAELIEGLDWPAAVGRFDIGFVGQPGANPGKWFAQQVEAADKYNALFGQRMISQLIVQSTGSPAETAEPRRRFNEMLRCVAAWRGGVNPWVNVGTLDNVNGAECFERAAIDVLVKYEDWFWDGARATSEFRVTGLRSAADDLAAFRLPDKPVLLLVFNDRQQPKDVTLTWARGTPASVWTDGLTGRRLAKGGTCQLRLLPFSTQIIECKGGKG